jgi:hypothetical protein
MRFLTVANIWGSPWKADLRNIAVSALRKVKTLARTYCNC